MKNRIVSVAIACVLAVGTSGCATMKDTFGPVGGPIACAVVGGAAGAVVGAIASDWRNKEDHRNDQKAGYAIGGGSGAVLGALMCALAEEEAKNPPTVRASCSPSSGAPPLSVECRCVASTDIGELKSYSWDFGDGGRSTEQNPKHTYTAAGNYNAKCTATNTYDVAGSGSAAVSVAAPATKKTIVLRGINFDFDKAVIKPEFEGVLDAGADVLKENPGVSVQVTGYTDSVGTDDYNMGLSDRRAKAVRDYLVSRGIEATRLVAVGRGENDPVADNGTADGRAQNRRVELDIQQ